MKIVFHHRTHRIVLARGVLCTTLSIDGKLFDSCCGLSRTQFAPFTLCGAIEEENGSVDSVHVRVAPHLFFDMITMRCANSPAQTKRVSWL